MVTALRLFHELPLSSVWFSSFFMRYWYLLQGTVLVAGTRYSLGTWYKVLVWVLWMFWVLWVFWVLGTVLVHARLLGTRLNSLQATGLEGSDDAGSFLRATLSQKSNLSFEKKTKQVKATVWFCIFWQSRWAKWPANQCFPKMLYVGSFTERCVTHNVLRNFSCISFVAQTYDLFDDATEKVWKCLEKRVIWVK